VEDGQVSPPQARVRVPIGNTVLIRVKSDVADEVHIHGYDLVQEVAAGGSASFEFVADVPGIFEVELENARLPLVELEVGP
jgi:heme/copper-type cytochrome/quinol oxidase subunit 2